MSNLRTSTRALTATGLLCFGTAAIIAGCGGGGSSSSPTPAVSPAQVSGVTCASGTGGVAYIPDGVGGVNSGAGGGGSLTIIPFETTTGTFSPTCPQTQLSLPMSINDLAISPQGIAIALQSNNTFIGINQLLSGGSPNTYENSQPFPSPSGAPFIASSIAIVPNGNTGFAVGAPFQGFVGVNNLFGLAPAPLPTTTAAAAPTLSPGPAGTTPIPTVTQTPVPFAGLVSYSDVASNSSKSTGLVPATGSRTSVALAPNAATILARGSDLAAFSLVSTLAGYYFTFPADNGATDIATPPPNGIKKDLGFTNQASAVSSGLAGHGLIAFYPGDSSQAIIGQTSLSALTATHVTNLPNGITEQNSFTVPNSAIQITSVAVNSSDNYALIGTQNGLFVANLSSNGNNAATATSDTSSKILSVGFSPDGKFALVQTATALTVYSFTNGIISQLTNGTFTLPKAATGDYLVVR